MTAQERIQFLVDEKGRRQSIVLPMWEYEELLKNLADLALIAERKAESAEPIDAVRKRLEEK